MNVAGHDIGVCSWSLQATDTADLIQKMRQLKLSHLQLAIVPLIALGEAEQADHIERIRAAGITITAGMIGFPNEDYSTIARIRQSGGYMPDDAWPQRREITAQAAAICKRFQIKFLSAHSGFIPTSNDPKYKIITDRMSEIAALLETFGVMLLMETGQEQASELLQFINDVRGRNAAVNFDAANMLRFGSGDPLEAVATLGRHIRHVHVKDARASDRPGTSWGTEVPLGFGEVPVRELLDALHNVGYTGPLVIERETGDSRMLDVQTAVEILHSALTAPVKEKN